MSERKVTVTLTESEAASINAVVAMFGERVHAPMREAARDAARKIENALLELAQRRKALRAPITITVDNTRAFDVEVSLADESAVDFVDDDEPDDEDEIGLGSSRLTLEPLPDGATRSAAVYVSAPIAPAAAESNRITIAFDQDAIDAAAVVNEVSPDGPSSLTATFGRWHDSGGAAAARALEVGPFKSAQTRGNVNVLGVRWKGPARIVSVSDTVGNIYRLVESLEDADLLVESLEDADLPMAHVCADGNLELGHHARAVLSRPAKTFWLSFADNTRAGGDQFLGACIVAGADTRDAIRTAHALGINPGGDVASLETPPKIDKKIGPAWRNRLLTREECAAFDREIAK